MDDESTPESPTDLNVDLADERAQRVMDHRELYERLVEARTFLAQAKVNRLLSAAGLLDGGIHPKQYEGTISTARRTVDTITTAIAALGEHGISEGAVLEVASVADVSSVM